MGVRHATRAYDGLRNSNDFAGQTYDRILRRATGFDYGVAQWLLRGHSVSVSKGFTKTAVAALPPRDRPYEVADPGQPGLYVRVHPSGAKSVAIRYVVGEEQRRLSIGKLTPAFPWDAAKKKAQRLLGDVKNGADPSGEKRDNRAAPTFDEFAERYVRDHIAVACKPKTRKDYEGQLRRDILPAFGKRKIADISHGDVDAFAAKLRARAPVYANRVVALLSAMFAKAEKWGMRPQNSNPCKGIDRAKERGVHDPLTEDERARLERAIDDAEAVPRGHPEYLSRGGLAAIRLLALTGCRPAEIFGLEWSHVDFAAGCLRLPDSKTGARIVPLSGPALDVLERLEAEREPEVPWVCASEGGKQLANARRTWRTLRQRAGIGEKRLYSLRHSVGSDLLDAGVPLSDIGKLLGHRQASTTERYSKARDEAARRAADALGAIVTKARSRNA